MVSHKPNHKPKHKSHKTQAYSLVLSLSLSQSLKPMTKPGPDHKPKLRIIIKHKPKANSKPNHLKPDDSMSYA